MINAELSMSVHVSRTVQICFYHLRRLRSICRQLGCNVTAWLVSAFVLSRLNYCNAVTAGLLASTLAPFQRVLHAAARLVLNLRPRDHVLAALRELHWLPVAQRIDCKLCLLVHKSSWGQAPEYISNMLKLAANDPSLTTLQPDELLLSSSKLSHVFHNRTGDKRVRWTSGYSREFGRQNYRYLAG